MNLLVHYTEVFCFHHHPSSKPTIQHVRWGQSTCTQNSHTVSYDHDICQTMKIIWNRREKSQREQRLAIELNHLFFSSLKHNSVKLIYEHRFNLCLLHIKCHPRSEQERKLRRIQSQRLLGTHAIESIRGEKVTVLSC